MDARFATTSDLYSKLIGAEDCSCFFGKQRGEAFRGETSINIANCDRSNATLLLLCRMESCSKKQGLNFAGDFSFVHSVDERRKGLEIALPLIRIRSGKEILEIIGPETRWPRGRVGIKREDR